MSGYVIGLLLTAGDPGRGDGVLATKIAAHSGDLAKRATRRRARRPDVGYRKSSTGRPVPSGARPEKAREFRMMSEDTTSGLHDGRDPVLVLDTAIVWVS